MGVLDRIRAHANPGEIRTIEVPEWGEAGRPLVIHHTMVSLGDIAAVQAVSKDPLRQNVDLICLKAMDETGKPLFRRVDALELMQIAAPVVVLRIIAAMGLASSPAVEDAAKN